MGSKENGWVYVVTVGGVTKVGKSRNPKQRVKTVISSSGLDGEPEVSIFETGMYSDVEREAHESLSGRIGSKEWFKCSHSEAVYVCESLLKPLSEIEPIDTPHEDYCIALFKALTAHNRALVEKSQYRALVEKSQYRALNRDFIDGNVGGEHHEEILMKMVNEGFSGEYDNHWCQWGISGIIFDDVQYRLGPMTGTGNCIRFYSLDEYIRAWVEDVRDFKSTQEWEDAKCELHDLTFEWDECILDLRRDGVW